MTQIKVIYLVSLCKERHIIHQCAFETREEAEKCREYYESGISGSSSRYVQITLLPYFDKFVKPEFSANHCKDIMHD